jgi:hypothetical protein
LFQASGIEDPARQAARWNAAIEAKRTSRIDDLCRRQRTAEIQQRFHASASRNCQTRPED